MAANPNKLSQFWQELKRRKVVRVITAYAAAAFVIIELINNVTEPLSLPDWTATLVILLLVAGFPIVVILSWIFDVTPKGLKKTGTIEEEQAMAGKGHIEVRRKLRVSDLIIAILLIFVIILLYPRIFNSDSFKDIRNEEGKITISIMPFENFTGDSLFDGLEKGIQNLVVTRLSNVDELLVKQAQTAIDNQVNSESENMASITPIVAAELAKGANVGIALLGSLHKSDSNLRLTSNLLNAETEEIFKSFELNVSSDNAIFTIADSLTVLISSYFEIRNLENQVDNDTRLFSNTDITEAYRFFSKGTERFFNMEFESALSYFEKALEIDPGFVMARFFKYVSYWNLENWEEASQVVDEMYTRLDECNYLEELYVFYAKSLFDKDLELTEKYLDLILGEVPNSRGWNYETGRFFIQAGRYRDALPFLEKALEIDRSWGTAWEFSGLYTSLGLVYRDSDQLEKEKETYELGLKIHPDHPSFLQLLAENAFLQGEVEKAERYIVKYREVREARGDLPSLIGRGIGNIYMQAKKFDDAEDIYRSMMANGQDSRWVKADLAFLLFNHGGELREGMELINQALHEDPESPDLLRIKGLGLYKMKEYEAAFETLTSAYKQEYMYVNETFQLLQQVDEALQTQVGV